MTNQNDFAESSNSREFDEQQKKTEYDPEIVKIKDIQDGDSDEDKGDDVEEEEEDDDLVQMEKRSVKSETLSEIGSDLEIDEEEIDEVPEGFGHSDTNKYKQLQFGDVHVMEGEKCSCRKCDSIISYISLMESMSTISPNHDNQQCICDNVIRAYNKVFSNTNKPINSYRLAFTDMFYRFRHEILFKLLCMSLNLPVQHSDMKFSQFGIDSERTPDLIIEREGVLYIIEVTATSSVEKAAQAKGMEKLGFESKYQREIDMFTDKGISNSYLPMFFDMSDPGNLFSLEQFNALGNVFNVNTPFKNLMFGFCKTMANLTFNFKDSLILPSALLFNNVVNIEPKHESIEFLYRRTGNPIPRCDYNEFVVSPAIYSKINNDRSRFYWMLDNTSYTDLIKLVFVIDSISNRIELRQSSEGAVINDLRQILNDNDNISLLKFTKIKTGNQLIDSNHSEHGVRFYEIDKESSRRKQDKNNRSFDEIPLIAGHPEQPFEGDFNMDRYKKMIESYTSNNYHSLHFDKNYEDVLIKSICKFDQTNSYEDLSVLPKGLLGKLRAEEIDIDEVMSEVRIKYQNLNSVNDELPLKRLKMKQPFLLPIADINQSSYCELSNKNTGFIKEITEELREKNPYTEVILKGVLSEKYNMYTKSKMPSATIMDLERSRYEISNKINRLQKELYKKGSLDDNKQLSKTTDPGYRPEFLELRKSYNQLNKEIKVKRKSEGVSQDISYLRLPTKGKGSNLRRLYDIEMAHFKDRGKQSTIEGVGVIHDIESDYEADCKIFQEICAMMTDDRGINPDVLIDEKVYDDAQLLKDLKSVSIEKYTKIINQSKNSSLGHACAFISRMAHSLMFYSQLPFSGDYVRVDNLGYKNVLMMVKGGKKIFKSKASKLYRLIFPISTSVLPWYIDGHRNKGSFQYTTINSIVYAITPWSTLHESILTDSISFYPRVMSFTFLNLNPAIDLKLQFTKVSLNVMLSFHNRRNTEVMLANLRYILLSTLGDFTGITQILSEFFDFNYDRFQSFIRNSILINYPVYFKTLQALKSSTKTPQSGKIKIKDINISDFVRSRLRNIFTGSVISNVEDMALMIYSTFLMTKAPYQKVVERSRNLKGILEINEYFSNTVGLSLNPEEQTEKISVVNDGDLISYSKDLFGNDFNFDPKFCALVGGFVDNIYEAQDDVNDIETQWLRIINKPWDEMATSTGLRGDYDKVEDFWGQKGYFVVYKELLNTPGFPDKLTEIFNMKSNEDDKRKILKSINEVYAQKLSPDKEFLIFHAVDKVQWRGGREIYVMDVHTKVMQQPIEKFMAVLCKKLDNELISIPSDRRAQVIHHAIFEKDLPNKDMLTWYLTLDCSKWAPKSVFIKFVITILNMRCIPNSFKTHFMNYISKLYNKRIYFNKGEVETLMKNPKYTDLCSRNLVEDKTVGGYYMLMPYSWVMGIFNYTSSFLHAANQKYFSYLLMKSSLLSYKEESSLVMFAHSDDSGGRLSVSNEKMAQRALILYEIFLKSCNHLLSKKKSVVSRIYFEILSVIYIFNKLLALLPKFLGGLRFLPTDKGPAQDMLQSYSKCIEVIVAGGDFAIAYIVLKVYSQMVWRFYYNRCPTISDYERPVQYLGLPDAHPLFVLLCGSDADILRILRNGVDLTKLVTFVNTFISTMDSEGPIKPIKFEIKVKGIKRGFEDFLETFRPHLESWSIRNVNYHNTGMNTLSFLRKLNDSGFVGSLVNESTVRRISRGYFLRIGDSAITRLGNVKLSKIMDAITLCQSYSTGEGTIKHLLDEVLKGDNIAEIEEQFSKNEAATSRMIELIKGTLKSPLKIYKYLNMLSMDNRKINRLDRTLKPTLVQLIKSSHVFSVNFDPASLVSFIKEPNLRWALSDVRGLSISQVELTSLMSKLGYDMDEVDPDVLLRVCRTYGRENTKNIYIYSRVPGEIRQIKTYSAFLTFLSVNSFSNHEIHGLTIKLTEKEVSKEYLEPYVNEEIYFVNNVISLFSVLVTKCGKEFILKIKLQPIKEIEWSGGGIVEFIDFFETTLDTDVRYHVIRAQVCCLKIRLLGHSPNAGFLDSSAYYTFLKSQKVKRGWYGRGEVYIKIDNSFYSFVLLNNEVSMLYTNRSGKLPLHHSEYIQDVLKDIGISLSGLKRPKVMNYNRPHFGLDATGDFSVYKGRELSVGVMVIILDSRNDYVDHLGTFEVVNYNLNSITILKGYENFKVFKKINVLPVRKSELVPIIKCVLDPNDFKQKLLECGLNDFEDFIYTEVLTEFGKDIVIEFEKFIDNYQGSKLYEVMKHIYDNGYSSINKTPVYSPLPASEGSLVRLLIDYSSYTNEIIINTPVNLDSRIMQIRSEYPESMATLLGEKLAEYHSKIYSHAEVKEISDHYSNILESQNVESVRGSIIKLMTFWGYGSLVHSIQEFTLSVSNKNYCFFNPFNLAKNAEKTYADLYPFVIKRINSLMLKWKSLYSSIDMPLKLLSKNSSKDIFINNYLIECCMGTYNLVLTNVRNSIYNMQYINVLMGYMQEEDFIAELQNSLKENYILGSVPLNWNLRFEFVALINTLKTLWQKSRSNGEFKLDFINKLQRYPVNKIHFKSLLSEFDLKVSPKEVYYNSFLNDTVLSYIMSKGSLSVDGVEYRISTRVSNPSSIKVPMSNFLKHPAPLTTETLEHEIMEDIITEYEMSPVDDETILECMGEIPKPHYIKPTLRKIHNKTGKIVMATVKWVVDPYIANRERLSAYYRQVGENLVIITDTYIPDFRENFPNSGVRLVNMSKHVKEEVKPYLLHYTLSHDLNKKGFLQSYVGGQEFFYNESDESLIRANIIRNLDGKLVEPGKQGFFADKKVMGKDRQIVELDGYLEYTDITGIEGQVVPEEDRGALASSSSGEDGQVGEEEMDKVMRMIDSVSGEGNLHQDSIKAMKDKYINRALRDKIPIGIILKSVMKESELLKLNSEILSNQGDISAEDQKKMFLSPEYFGLGRGLNRQDINPLKDKKVRAEIDSFYPGLSNYIGSNTLKMSNKIKKVIDANFKMWARLNKTSKTKVDNKNFLLTLFASLCSNSLLSDDEEDDQIWQEIINKTTIYLSFEEDEEEDEDTIRFIFNVIPASRLRYRSAGT